MKISDSVRNTGYTLLFIIGGIAIYIAQHHCVKYGFDAVVSAAQEVEGWMEASK